MCVYGDQLLRTALICHEEDALSVEGLARWMASFSDLGGMVVIREEGRRKGRLLNEIKRSGWWRLPDIVAFRIFSRLFLARADKEFVRSALDRLRREYPELPADLPRIVVASPNEARSREFLQQLAPDLVMARCKFLLRKSVFSVPTKGTFVMHPGICPEYRNSHGCFWALANDDLERVGMTLLRIDEGVDTGPVYGYYSYPYDEVAESHTIIQHRVVLDNLSAIAAKLLEVGSGTAEVIDTQGRASGVWGQPWLTSYLRWKTRARRRRGEGVTEQA